MAPGEVLRVDPTPNFAMPIPVRLVPYDIEHVDPYETDYFFATGPYWTAVFSSDESIQEVFSIGNARLEFDPNVVQGGVFIYTISGTVTCNGIEYPISTEGRRSIAFDANAGQRESVQIGVANTADLVQAVVKNCQTTKKASDIDLHEELLKLYDLREKGLLTDEEFEMEKKELLDSN